MANFTSLYVTVSDTVDDHICRMAKTGLWGDTPGEVLTTLVLNGVRNALADGLIHIPVLAEIDEDLPMPEPAPFPIVTPPALDDIPF